MSASAIPPLRPMPIQELKLLDQSHHWQIDQPIDGLDSLRPVRGKLSARHRGNLLEVEGEMATVISLCCDRCLQQYNQPLRAKASEVISLEEPPLDGGEVFELEGASIDAAVSEHLDPRGNFDPEQWVYEQLSLQIPLVSNCGAACPGPGAWESVGPSQDPRWAALGQLKP
ncbi:DUF177 domain-containing protein [Cyanobium sp. WAJ14-Wanaka]|uniref:YceD family protein n=1 Tax=Cyanobium sp. WAJ14-Wanaka TaxID=2823725 RepID=UPI0020CF530C|nr:DUF177 domain-containing protein [Cyanobium sp. WAJ14-Wanaka]